MNVERKMRLSQTVSPFGVGAIFDLLGESFVAADIGTWGPRGQIIRLERFERELGISKFRAAPSSASRFTNLKGIPFARFPRTLFCPTCRSIRFWRRNDEQEGEQARCGCQARALLVPMRFIAICADGHMHDVPWKEWAHSRATTPDQVQCHSPNLALLSRGASAGLDALIIRCRTCKAQRSLMGISSKDSLRPLEGRYPEAVRCPGTQPWQHPQQGDQCSHLLQVVQRGASNVYFANTTSALDIPPGSDYDPYAELTIAIKSHPSFAAIADAPKGPAAPILIDVIAEQLGCSADDVRAALAEELGDTGPANIDDEDMLTGEWHALTDARQEYDPRSNFVKERVTLLKSGKDISPATRLLDGLIADVVLATRLREVRALTSFTRLEPSGRAVPVDMGRRIGWLPAIEVFGEGVFVSFGEKSLAKWEQQASEVGDLLESRRKDALIGHRLPEVTSRYVLLHTFAHLLIRQLVFECGYSAASLRERVYSRTPTQGQPQAGVLIYTAAGDAEGTLGGLVRQGRPPRLAATILRALERGAWCSSDPLCLENPGQGFGSLNLAACHACSLLPETSCETGNRLLDRSLVIGNPEKGIAGYFEAVLGRAVRQSATDAGGDE